MSRQTANLLVGIARHGIAINLLLAWGNLWAAEGRPVAASFNAGKVTVPAKAAMLAKTAVPASTTRRTDRIPALAQVPAGPAIPPPVQPAPQATQNPSDLPAPPASDVGPPPKLPPAAAAFGLDTRLESVPAVQLPAATLEEITDIAMANSPNLREAVNQVAAAQGQALQVGLYPNPTINASSPQIAGNESQWNGFATQEFVTAGKLRLSRAAALRAVQQAQLRYVRTRFDLLTNVRTAFYGVLVAQRRVEVLRMLVNITTRSRQTAEQIFQQGLGTRTDALLLRIEQDRAEIALNNAETALAADRRSLAAAIGVPTLAITRVEGNISAGLPDFEYEAVRQGVISRNALAEIARVEVARNRILLQRAFVEPIPNIVAMGGFQYQVAPFIHDQGLFQVTMAVPLWNRNQGNIRSAQANIAQASNQVQRVQNELSGQLAVAMSSFIQAQQQVDFYEQEILPRSREVQGIAQRAYAVGEFDFLRLLQAQRTLLETNLAYVNAQDVRWRAAAAIAGLLQVEQFP